MTVLEMIKEWRKGCGNSLFRDAHKGVDLHIPEKCEDCTRALIDAIEKKLDVKPLCENGNIALSQSDLNEFLLANGAIDMTNKSSIIEKTYRYEKVTESIFDLKGEFERGLLSTRPQDVHFTIPTEEALINVFNAGGVIYRKFEINPVEELARGFNKIDTDGGISCKWDDLSIGCRNRHLAHAKYAIEKLEVK